MTYSICVHEADGSERAGRHRFGVAVTTRYPSVGSLCPHVGDHAAVATQSVTDASLGRRGVDYVADGLAVDDALEALLNADDDAELRQVHGVDRDGDFAFTGTECPDWSGHERGTHPSRDARYTVAGNSITGADVLAAVAAAYEAADWDDPLSKRLVDALGAGAAAGGDRRTDLPVGSAAVRVTSTESRSRPYDDLRVDAAESPIADLRETYRLAKRGYEAAIEKYA
ncbi:DUF1028 domain-containing protein [Salinirarus marinus]|uniref:DUF1028 domain-containing protein n=1 Tax=Salinirarus marinus TaxID=3068310 RepID=UPI003C6C1B13